MKHYLRPFVALLILTLMNIPVAYAEIQKKMVIALKSDDLELTETDVSDLAVGESRTIETDSGKIIDILRTSEGVELYVNGELLEMDFDSPRLHGTHEAQTHVEIHCADGEDCEEDVFIIDGHEGFDIGSLAAGGGKKVIIHKNIEIACMDDEQGKNCSDDTIWMSGGEEIDIEALHEQHSDDAPHKVIVIRKEITREN